MSDRHAWERPESRDLLAAALDSIDHGVGDIRDILVTHVHRDHYTQAVALRREVGARVQVLAVLETVAHLEVLVELGRLSPTTTDPGTGQPVQHYLPPGGATG